MNMNQWGNEQFMMMPHMMGQILPGPNIGQPALLPTPLQPPHIPDGMGQPLLPPNFMIPDWNQGNQPKGPPVPNTNSENFIGPRKPDVDLTKDDGNNDKEGNDNNGRSLKDHRDGRRDYGDRDRDRGRRPRSPYNRRDNRDRNERSRSDRRERRAPRWTDNNDIAPDGLVPMGMPGNPMMGYANNVLMGQQQMDMSNMQNMIPGMSNMLPGMNMMPGMMHGMDPNMMHMQMNMNSGLQPISISIGILLPPLPNVVIPARRERPPGCRTIFVGGVPHSVGETVIREIFERFGVVSEVRLHKQGVCHVRFGSQELVEQSLFISGYRFKRHDQIETEATTILIDYALNREDQNEFERNKRKRTPTPPRIELYSAAAFAAITDKIKSDTDFAEAAPTLAGWLERGECNKKNANAFYSLIQASNNQIRRLYADKMTLDEHYQDMKTALKDKFSSIILQFELVGKILTAAKMQRVSDHFSKQQRRNLEMWLKMTEDVENIKEEFNSLFEEDEVEDKTGKASSVAKKYEELRVEYENLQYELEGYRNEAHLAKDEAERKFEKFKAQFIAQQALQNNLSAYPPPPQPKQPPLPLEPPSNRAASQPPPPPVATSEAKLISVLTAFLLVHPLGASLDYMFSYVKSIIPSVNQATVHNILQKYDDVFSRQSSGVGANFESKWTFVTYDVIKKEIPF